MNFYERKINYHKSKAETYKKMIASTSDKEKKAKLTEKKEFHQSYQHQLQEFFSFKTPTEREKFWDKRFDILVDEDATFDKKSNTLKVGTFYRSFKAMSDDLKVHYGKFGKDLFGKK